LQNLAKSINPETLVKKISISCREIACCPAGAAL